MVTLWVLEHVAHVYWLLLGPFGAALSWDAYRELHD